MKIRVILFLCLIALLACHCDTVETIKCLDKILYYKSNETLSDEELDKLMLLLEKKSNKTILLSNLSEYRSKGKFEINEHSLQLLALIFSIIS